LLFSPEGGEEGEEEEEEEEGFSLRFVDITRDVQYVLLYPRFTLPKVVLLL